MKGGVQGRDCWFQAKAPWRFNDKGHGYGRTGFLLADLGMCDAVYCMLAFRNEFYRREESRSPIRNWQFENGVYGTGSKDETGRMHCDACPLGLYVSVPMPAVRCKTASMQYQ